MIEKIDRVIAKLRSIAAKARKDAHASVIVGYTAGYAVYVHENLEANHPVGQAKFLEQPARENAAEISDVVKDALQHGKTTPQALVLGGLTLQGLSQKLCPVDTANLKNSAFTRLEETP